MEKRPLLIVFLSLFLSVLILEIARLSGMYGALLLSFFLMLLVLLVLKKSYRIFLFIFLPFFLSFMILNTFKTDLKEVETSLVARVIHIRGNSFLVDRVKTQSGIGTWKKVNGRIRIVFDGDEYKKKNFVNIGTWIFAKGILKKTRQYPFFTVYVNSSDIRSYGFAPYFDDFSTEVLYRLGRLRKNYEDFIRENSSNWDIISAVIFGTAPGYENKNLLLNSGIYHLFVVSGLHVNLLMYIIYFLTGFISTNFRIRCLMSMTFITLYSLTIGYSFPAIRAMLMINLILFFKLLDYPQDKFNVLGLCGILIFLLDPLSVLSASFQMSFASTFIFMTIFDKKPENLLESSKATFNASISLIPLTILYFGNVYPLSTILSSLLLPTTIIPMILGGIMGFIFQSVKLNFLSVIFIKGVEPFANFIKLLTQLLLKVPLVSLKVPENLRIALFYLTLSLAIFWLSSSRSIFLKQSGQIP